MTYPGKKILQTAMFIAYKTEFTHMPAETWSEIIPRSTPDQILAPEHLIIQALRFNLEIRHPFRALKGASIELSEMLKGTYVPLPWDTRTPTDIQSAILKLPKRTDSVPVELSQKEFRKRLEYDYGLASHILKTSAQLTDAYFHYTPSQIMFAAHLLADEPLTLFLLSAKIPSDSPVAVRTLDTIRACAAMLSSHHSYTSSDTTAPDKEAREAEVKRIMDKLKLCRDPDKVDLVKLNEAHKRDAMQDGQLDERKAKRRKLDREAAQKEADDFFGPELPKNG
jgi:cyclin H